MALLACLRGDYSSYLLSSRYKVQSVARPSVVMGTSNLSQVLLWE